jgi:hypothetical protein
MKHLNGIAERDFQNGGPETRPCYLEAETERLLV